MNNQETIIQLSENDQLSRQINRLKPEEMERIHEIRSTITPENPQHIIQYGMKAQTKISNFADTVISEYKNNVLGSLGKNSTAFSIILITFSLIILFSL